MAVFRVEKNKGYTVMSNYHLRDSTLSLKAKGLLSQMLSLPEEWDYTLQGLSCINREKIDAIRTTVKELETAGYIIRHRIRNEQGQLKGSEYVIYEQPTLEEPRLENPMLGNPAQGNPMQLNKEDIKNKELLNIDLNNPSIYPPQSQLQKDGMDKMDAIAVYREIIKDNIEFDCLCSQFDVDRISEIFELIVETVCTSRKTIRIGGENIPAEIVKSRFMKLGQFHIEYVFDCLRRNTTKVFNIKNYLLTALYNAPVTMGNYYSAEVQHDLYGSE